MKSMGKNLLKLAAVLTVFVVNAAFGWTLYVTNNTPFIANVTAEWMGCRSDYRAISPGERIAIDASECLLTKLSATVNQTATISIGGTLFTATLGKAPDIRVVTASPYISSGQRAYNEFEIIGAVGSFRVGRFVQ